jgi:hypothetical protein
VASDYQFERMVTIFERCLYESQVFSRDVPNRSLVETTRKKEKNGSPWAVVAAGISDQEAAVFFEAGSAKAEHATIPLQVLGGSGSQGSILLQMRPAEWPSAAEPTAFVAHYAIGEGIPCVEVLKGWINLDLPNNDLRLFNLSFSMTSVELRACERSFRP